MSENIKVKNLFIFLLLFTTEAFMAKGSVESGLVIAGNSNGINNG